MLPEKQFALWGVRRRLHEAALVRLLRCRQGRKLVCVLRSRGIPTCDRG
jgi:hypothetical protein